MYSMVMMMAVASSGDVASFGGRNKGCDGGCGGHAIFDRSGCHGGGLLARWKEKKNSCCGDAAPACPAPCPTPCPAPCPAPVACPTPCPTPCATACPEPCDPCAKKKLFPIFHRKNKCETTCAAPAPCAAPCAAPCGMAGGCALPGAPVAHPAEAPKVMPKAAEPAKPAPKKET